MHQLHPVFSQKLPLMLKIQANPLPEIRLLLPPRETQTQKLQIYYKNQNIPYSKSKIKF